MVNQPVTGSQGGQAIAKLLIGSCDVVATMDDDGTELSGGSILIEDGSIIWVGASDPPDDAGAQRIDGRGTVALPGLVNTHHHLFQSLTRVRAQEHGLFDWLRELLPVWSGLDVEWVRAAASVGLAELALSGCTTTADHHYVFPSGRSGLLEAEIDAAREIGLRFHPCRGSMDRSEFGSGVSQSLVQDTDTVLAESEEALRRFHDPAPGAMLRIAIAPCSPFSATDRLMRESAELARRVGVRLHTHIAETIDEERFCLETYGKRPLEFLDEVGWLGPDVWLAHCVQLGEKDVSRIAETGTGAAWCPSSNMRLGSGVAPARSLLDAGAVVGIGVDGSASNDVGHMLAEARQALLMARSSGDSTAMSAREALRVATRGGAECLGRDDIGSIEPGKRADIALVGTNELGFAGAESDLLAAVLFCAPSRVRDLFVDGQPVVLGEQLVHADEDGIATEGRRVAKNIAANG